MSFIGWLMFGLKKEFAIARYGGRGKGSKIDPLNYAARFEEPLKTDDQDGGTLYDVVANMADDMEAIEDQIYNEQLQRDLFKAIACLPEIEQKVIYARFYCNASLSKIALAYNMTLEEARATRDRALVRLRKPSLSNQLCRYIDDHTIFYRSVSPSAFEFSGGSSVEWTVIDREREVQKTMFPRW